MQTTAATITRAEASRAAKIREMRPGDYAQIAALHVRNGLTIPRFEQWMALWMGNPAYQRGRGSLGWVLETERGNLAGSIGNVPLSCEFEGRRIRTATAYGWVVDEAYRSYSVMILSRFLRQDDVDLFVFVTVGEKAEPIYRNGFQLTRVPVGAWDKSVFWITNYRGFAKSVLAHQKRSRALAIPMSLGFRAWDALRLKTYPRPSSEYEVEFCPRFDGRFDQFWDALRRSHPRRLLPVRTRETLEWHFQHSGKSMQILTVSHESRMVAYAIFNRLDNPALGLKRVRMLDFQAIEGHGAAVKPVLGAMLRRCRDEGVHVLEVMGGWLERPDLPRVVAPYERRLSSWIYYYKAADPELAAALQNPDAWLPSSFDGDASL